MTKKWACEKSVLSDRYIQERPNAPQIQIGKRSRCRNRAVKALPFVADHRVLMREHGRFFFAEVFICPNAQMPDVLEATRQVREALLPLDWRLQHIVVEFTGDVSAASQVPSQQEYRFESPARC